MGTFVSSKYEGIKQDVIRLSLRNSKIIMSLLDELIMFILMDSSPATVMYTVSASCHSEESICIDRVCCYLGVESEFQ